MKSVGDENDSLPFLCESGNRSMEKCFTDVRVNCVMGALNDDTSYLEVTFLPADKGSSMIITSASKYKALAILTFASVRIECDDYPE